jgi:hypothetical protein
MATCECFFFLKIFLLKSAQAWVRADTSPWKKHTRTHARTNSKLIEFSFFLLERVDTNTTAIKALKTTLLCLNFVHMDG